VRFGQCPVLTERALARYGTSQKWLVNGKMPPRERCGAVIIPVEEAPKIRNHSREIGR
jgi:hypothetical protein